MSTTACSVHEHERQAWVSGCQRSRRGRFIIKVCVVRASAFLKNLTRLRRLRRCCVAVPVRSIACQPHVAGTCRPVTMTSVSPKNSLQLYRDCLRLIRHVAGNVRRVRAVPPARTSPTWCAALASSRCSFLAVLPHMVVDIRAPRQITCASSCRDSSARTRTSSTHRRSTRRSRRAWAWCLACCPPAWLSHLTTARAQHVWLYAQG